MKRKLSLLMVLMMMLTLIPMSSFAAIADVTQPKAATNLTPNGQTISSILTVKGEEYVVLNLNDILTSAKGGAPSLLAATDVVTLQFNNDAKVEGVATGASAAAALTAAQGTATATAGTLVNGVNAVGNRVVITGTPDTNVAPITAITDPADIYIFVKMSKDAGRKLVEVERAGGVDDVYNSLYYAEVSGTSVGATLTQSKKDVSRGTDKLGAAFVVRKPEGNKVTLTLPRGVEWNTNTKVIVGGTVATTTALTGSLTYNDEELEITYTATNELGLASVNFDTVEITVVPKIDVTRDARLGDITVRIDSDNVSSDLVIATYKDYNVTAEVTKVQNIVAGKDETIRDYVVKLTLSGIAGSITLDREIEMNFNNGKAMLKSSPSTIKSVYEEVDGDDGFRNSTGTFVDYVATNDYVNFLSFEADDNEEIELEFYVKGDWDAAGKDLTVDIKGRDINEKGIVLAKISAPATVSAEKSTDVKIGVQKQAASDITITETAAGSLTEGEYVINFSENSDFFGIYFNSGIKVEAVEGDLDFDYTVNRDGSIVLDVNRESRTATKLVVSGVTVSLDRTLPEGQLDARFGANFNDSRLDKGTIVEFPYLNVTNAAPGTGTLRPTTVFTIGQSTFTVSGETQTLDAAPYISNNRTMLPIGAVAQVIGATVNYSPSTRTAVFTKDNLVVTMNLDTNILLANGSVVTMDAKPEIVNSRAFVPVVFVAQAFGVQNGTDIVYDAAAQTITMFPAN